MDVSVLRLHLKIRLLEAKLALADCHIREALEAIQGVDDAHHKQWIIDQVVRALTGDGYADWVHKYNEGDCRAYWDEGMPP